MHRIPTLIVFILLSTFLLLTGCDSAPSSHVAQWWYNEQPEDFHYQQGAGVGGRNAARTSSSSTNNVLRGSRR